MTKQFRVVLDDKPGELAKLAGALAEKGINIRTGGATTHASKGVVVLIPSDETKTREVLEAQKFSFTEDEVLIARLEDKPGALAQLAKNLAAAGINIKSFIPLPTGGPTIEVAVTVDNIEKARPLVK